MPAANPFVPALLVLLLLAGCNNDTGVKPIPKERETPIPEAGAGAVSGTVTVTGDTPKPKRLPLDGIAECAQHWNDAAAVDNDIRVANGKVADVFIHVTAGLDPSLVFATPTEPVVIANHRCRYEPRVSGAMVAQPIKFLNQDPATHNIHAFDAANREAFNFSLPSLGASKIRYFKDPQVMARLKCDLHGWMAGALAVLPHPFFAVSSEDGAWALPRKLPAGTYTLEARHEVLGTKSQTVTVKAGETVTVAFSYP